MAGEHPTFDAGAIADALAQQLDVYRNKTAGTVPAESAEPMFRRAPDGAVVHRSGAVVSQAPPLQKPV